ncbi:MAG: hypothetical protein KDJ69_14005 [Nitratireductor sp.]|nr:hypothetical protein [Nitratireductor sp.]
MAGSAAISFSGHVPYRESAQAATAGAEIVVGFSDRVLLPVPAFAADLKTDEIRLEAMDTFQDAAVRQFSWRAKRGGVLPAFVEVPLSGAGDTRYRICIHSKQAGKKQCRAYRIIPAPGMKP